MMGDFAYYLNYTMLNLALMQKRHYEAIADILKDAKSTISNEIEYGELCARFALNLLERNLTSNFKYLWRTLLEMSK